MRALAELLKRQSLERGPTCGAIMHPDGRPYPEVTGYCIPTLLATGHKEAAVLAGDFLVNVQHGDGSFLGIDGVKAAFDTAAAAEGLTKLSHVVQSGSYENAASSAFDWLEDVLRDRPVAPNDEELRLYNVRSRAIMGQRKPIWQWLPNDQDGWNGLWGHRARVHYVAYALEGMWRMGYGDPVLVALEQVWNHRQPTGLMPFTVGSGWVQPVGTCVPATAQIAMLCGWAGWTEQRDALLETLDWRLDHGGIQEPWALKFMVDALMS